MKDTAVRKREEAIRLSLVAFVTVFSLLGCSLLLDFDETCSGDDECGGGLVCHRGYCVSATQEGDVPGGDEDTLASDTTDEEVSAPVGLVNAICPQLFMEGEASEPLPAGTIVIGIIVPLQGEPFTLLGRPIRNSAQLAAREVNAAGGVFGTRLALLVCDARDPVAAAEHLVNNANVPAIIGPLDAQSAASVTQQVAMPKGVVVISPRAVALDFSALTDSDLLWRTMPSAEGQAAAIAGLLHGPTGAGTPKVIVAGRNDLDGMGLSEALRRRFCGETACPSNRYEVWSYDERTMVTQFTAFVEQTNALQPDFMVLLGEVDEAATILRGLTLQDIPVPAIIGAHGLLHPRLKALLGDATAFPENIRGVSPVVSARSEYVAFEGNYVARDPTSSRPLPSGAAHAYDAFYLLTLAIAAIPEQQAVTGEAIAANFRRLSSGQVVRPGAGWATAAAALRQSSQATVNYVGASGPLDFDANTRDPSSEIEGFRFLGDGRIESLGVILDAGNDFHYPETEQAE